jgi:hypothetical protein
MRIFALIDLSGIYNLIVIEMSRFISPEVVFTWINSRISPSLKKVRTTADLTNGVVLLELMSKLYDDMIEESKIIFDPKEKYEVIHNLKLLQSTLDRLGLQFSLNVYFAICRLTNCHSQMPKYIKLRPIYIVPLEKIK